MQLVGYSNTAKDIGNECNIMVVKYLGENIGQERCRKKGIYACLADVAGSRDQRSTAVEPRLPTLPIHKPNKTSQ